MRSAPGPATGHNTGYCPVSCGRVVSSACAHAPAMVTIPAGVAHRSARTRVTCSESGRNSAAHRRHRQCLSRSANTRSRAVNTRPSSPRPNGLLEGTLPHRPTKRGVWVYDANATFRDPGFKQARRPSGRLRELRRSSRPMSPGSTRRPRADIACSRKPNGSTWRAPERRPNVRLSLGQGCRGMSVRQWVRPDHDGGLRRRGHVRLQDIRSPDLARTAGSIPHRSDRSLPTSSACTTCRQRRRMGRGLPHGSTHELPAAPAAKRVVKGGSWGTLAHNLRIAERVPALSPGIATIPSASGSRTRTA